MGTSTGDGVDVVEGLSGVATVVFSTKTCETGVKVVGTRDGKGGQGRFWT